MAEQSKQYDPKTYETTIYQKWEDANVFAPDIDLAKSGKKPYAIMLPPPNITGVLHMGHALQDTIMDILSRFHRMQGQPVLWLPGTDHAALPTNKILVDKLAQEGKSPHDIGREGFLKRAGDWYAKTGAEILHQMKRLGCSCDWSRSRFTMDSEYYQAVQEAFVQYFKKGYIYRGDRMVNWDPASQTTVSDLEIDWKTEKIPFYTFQYGPFQISTSRPETKFGDKYVVMHPEDSRYEQYEPGQKLELEWINGPATATVIKDSAVDPKFGTGVMTITPWHDAVDFEIAQRHNLDREQIIGFDGKLLPIASEFAGMSIQEARAKVVEKLQGKGLLISVDENYEHNVALNDRGKGVIEPQIMRQWFLDMSKLKDKTIKVAEDEIVKFIPERWKEHFLTWMRNVKDWNINRQIWLGHRLPVWWKPGAHGTNQEEGNFVVSIKKPEGEWQQDPDVLDTWFSSALWPFATLGWPNQTEDLKTFYPTSVLVTAKEILYLWVARMIFSGLELAGDIPFQEVFIHPVVLAKNGQRMSKSLGTGVDPLGLIEKYGADATRFGLMYQMSYDSQSLKFDEEAVKSARNFANKIWNIARFLDSLGAGNTPGVATTPGVKEAPTVADLWIQHRFSQTAAEVTSLINAYKFGEAARLIYDFVWKDFADWYIEILKVEGSPEIARKVFQKTLALLHPFMPFITEVLWKGEKMLIVSAFPTENTSEVSPRGDSSEVERVLTRFQSLVTSLRSLRVLFQIPAGEKISVVIKNPPLPQALATLVRGQLASLQNAAMKEFPTSHGEIIAVSTPSLTGDSLKRAQDRLSKQAGDLHAEIARQGEILQRMRGKAPAEKVEEKEKTLADAQKSLAEVTHSLHLLDS